MKTRELLKHHPEKGLFGRVDLINIIAISGFITYNLIDCLFRGDSLTTIFFYIIPLLISLLLMFLLKNRVITSCVYLILGLMTISFSPYETAYSGLLLIILSFNELRNRKYGIVIIGLSFVALSFRLINLEATPPTTISMFLLFAYIFLNYYLRIFHKPKHKLATIKKGDYDIIRLYGLGYTCQEINDKLELNIGSRTVRDRITKARAKQGCSNDLQFALKLLQMQEIENHYLDT